MKPSRIGAIVLAAGLSSRMGKSKPLLPWGDKTIIQKIVGTLLAAKIDPIMIVTGEFHKQIKELFDPKTEQLIIVTNSRYADGEMLHSLQLGLESMPTDVRAVMIVLGDQPQIEASTVLMLTRHYLSTYPGILIPSFEMRRGHPWIVDRKLWQEIMELNFPNTLREFLGKHTQDIVYLTVNTPTILEDIDTPEDYQRKKP